MKWCVVYATDENGLDLYEHSRAVLKRQIPDAKVVLLTDFDGSSDDAEIVNVRYLLDKAGISEHYANSRYRFPLMSAARLVLPETPEINTAGYDRILYLDTDTLVLDGEAVVKMANEAKFGEAEVLGAPDDVPPLFLSKDNRRLVKIMNSVLETGCLEGNDQALVKNIMKGFYVNSGVLLIDFAKFADRYPWFIQGCLSVLANHQFKFFDQDMVNALLVTGALGTRFNDLVAGHGMIPLKGTAIAHYAGDRRAKDAFFAKAREILGLR